MLYPKFFVCQDSKARPLAEFLEKYGFSVRVGEKALLGEVAFYHHSERRAKKGERTRGKIAWASHQLFRVCPTELLATPFLAEFCQKSVDEGVHHSLMEGVRKIFLWNPLELCTFWGGEPTDSCRGKMLVEWLPLAREGYRAAQSFARNGEPAKVAQAFWAMERGIRLEHFS